MFSTLAGVNYLLHTPDHLSTVNIYLLLLYFLTIYQIIESVVSGLHVNDKIMRKTVANLCYDVSNLFHTLKRTFAISFYIYIYYSYSVLNKTLDMFIP